MRSLILRRVLTWVVATLMLVTLAIALVIVWTANQREWYLDLPGTSATLDLNLSAGARAVATAVLGGLIALALATLIVEFRSVRHLGAERAPPGAPATGKTFTYTPVGSLAARKAEAASTGEPGGYSSAVVGEAGARRAEQTLPPHAVAGEDEPETLPPAARVMKQRPAMRPRTVQLGVDPPSHHSGPMHNTIPLHNGDRR